MNMSKTQVFMENDNIKNTQIKKVKSTSTRDSDTAPEAKTKTRIFKEESWLDGQHLPNTVSFKGNIGTRLKIKSLH